MRILFLHEVNYLEKPIFEMHEFPEHLASRGHEVAFMHYAEGWSIQDVRRQSFESAIPGRVLSSVSVELFTPQQSSRSLLDRLRMALNAGRQFRRVLEAFKPDVVVSFSVPTSGWQALRVAKRLGIPFVFRALDVSHKIRKSPFALLIKLAEQYIYKNASLVSANNPAMANYCISQGATPGKTVVDLPPLDLDHFEQIRSDDSSIKAEIGIPSESKVILYMGSFFYFSGLPEVIKRFSETIRDDIELLLVGGGEQDQELKELASSLGIKNKVHFTGFVNFAELPKYLAAADVAINPMHRSLVSNAAFPNKVIQYMATGLPVVSTKLEGLELTFGQLEGLRFVNNAEEVVDEAVEMNSRTNLAALGDSNKLVVSRMFSTEAAVAKFESRLEELVRN